MNPNKETINRKYLMPFVNSCFEKGDAHSAIEAMTDCKMRKIAWAEYYYFTGHTEGASERAEKLLEEPDFAARFSGYMIYGFANLTLGRVQETQRMLAYVDNTFAEDTDACDDTCRAMLSFASFLYRTLLHIEREEECSLINRLKYLPNGLQPFGSYVIAYSMYLKGEYCESIGFIKGVMALKEQIYSVPSIYLNIVMAMNYMALRKVEYAEKYFMKAWETASADSLLEAFGEHHGSLGGLVEKCLKNEYKSDFNQIVDIVYQFSTGWRKIYKGVLGVEVADILSTTEFSVAMLASRGWKNKEIAGHMGISANTVKSHLDCVYQKLNISGRKELKQYMQSNLQGKSADVKI